MAEALTPSIIGKALAVPAYDIYQSAKGQLQTQLQYLRNEKFLKSIARRLQRIEKVKTFWSDNKEADVASFYYPSRVQVEEESPVTVSSLAEFPPGYCYVIEGTVGQGKSIFMRYLATQELRRAEASRIPIFAELRFLQAEETFEEFVFGAFEASGLKISKELFALYANSGRIVLFLDAFDEIDQSLVARTIRDLQRLVGHFPHLPIVISARPRSGIQQAAAFRVVKLAPLSRRDHKPFILQLTNSEAQTGAILKAVSKSSASIDELLTTPLLVTLMVILYAAQQHIPNTVAEFYSELFDVLFYKHDRTKSGFVRKRHVDVGEQKVKRLFEGVCFYSLLKRYRTFKASQFSTCVEHACKHAAVDVDVGKFRNELVMTACLLKEEGQELSFIHRSVQEFYAASFVAHSADAFAKKFYSVVGNQDDPYSAIWLQPLRFLSEIDEWRFAKFYWLPAADTFAKKLGLTADEVFAADYTLSGAHYDEIARGLWCGALFKHSKSTAKDDIESQLLEAHSPWFRHALDSPMLPITLAAYPRYSSQDWLTAEGKTRLGMLAETIVSRSREIPVRKGEKPAKFEVEGFSVTLHHVLGNASGVSGVVRMKLRDVFQFVGMQRHTLPDVRDAIRSVAQQRDRYVQLVRAEEAKTTLLALME